MMKRILFLCTFVCAAGLMSAQSDVSTKKACCKKSKAACTKTTTASADAETKEIKTTQVASAMTAADIAAENDETIVKKVCDYSGAVSFYKKNVCENSGKVSMEEVSFNEESGTFVNVSPRDMMNDKEGEAVKASADSEKSTKKACCSGSSKKACCKKSGA